jgi:hypothetical protein
MDPNANLQEQERIIAANAIIAANGRTATAVKARLYELREALCEWLDRGGFAPDWDKSPLASRYFVRAGYLAPKGVK